MSHLARAFGLLIVGGGPGGIAPFLAAHRTGRLDTLLADGVAIVDRAEAIGAGHLGDYAINSDSSGKTFADCLDGHGTHETELTRLADHPLTQQMKAAGDGTVSLYDAARFLGLVGDAVRRMIEGNAGSAVLTRHNVEWARRVENGWEVRIVDLESGQQHTVTARNLVIATGAHQPAQRLATEAIGGSDLQTLCGDRLLQSGDVVTKGGLEHISMRLAGKASPRVAIVGGSTSAVAVAHALLHRLPDVHFGEGGITLLHRRPLRIFYLDRDAARAEGYDEWTEDDVCQISGRVFRFAGFRLDSRELVMQARGIGGRAAEPRLQLRLIAEQDPAVPEILAEADLVIAALGYRPHALRILDRNGAPITLWAQTGPQMPMVDARCRVLDVSGKPLDNLFGIGLAAGFVPRGALGGEESFRGQANGLWLWQHDVGSIIVEAVVRPGQPVHDAKHVA